MISKRLQAIASFLDKDDLLADIGCDHGYLAILAKEKGLSFIELIDNKIGPLTSAKENLQTYSSADCSFKFTLSDGLANVDSLCNTFAICGMGAETIISIIENDLKKCQQAKKLILEANTKVPKLRKFLSDNSFKIINETLIFDSKYYEIIVVKYDNDTILNDEELLLGPILLKEKSPLFINRWQKRLNSLEKIITNNQSLINDDSLHSIGWEYNILQKYINQKKIAS